MDVEASVTVEELRTKAGDGLVIAWGTAPAAEEVVGETVEAGLELLQNDDLNLHLADLFEDNPLRQLLQH